MVEALRHEDFYVAGTWIDESLGVYVGWVARKGSFAEGMPLCNERGDVTLVFSGEEFPEPSTAQQLRKRGHDVDSSAAVIVPGCLPCVRLFNSCRKPIASRFSRPPKRFGTH